MVKVKLLLLVQLPAKAIYQSTHRIGGNHKYSKQSTNANQTSLETVFRSLSLYFTLLHTLSFSLKLPLSPFSSSLHLFLSSSLSLPSTLSLPLSLSYSLSLSPFLSPPLSPSHSLTLTPSVRLSPANTLCKKIGSRSGPTFFSYLISIQKL